MATTRRSIRRAVVTNLGDVIVCTATADGSDVTFIDAVHLVGSVNAYRGREVVVTGGTPANLAEVRYVISSSALQRGLGLDPALPADTVAGDELELINLRGVGYRTQDIHDQINNAIRGLGLDHLKPAQTITATFAYGTGMPLPADWRTFEGVTRLDSYDSASYRYLTKAPRDNGDGWWVDKANRQLMLSGRSGSCLDGATLEIRGMVDTDELLHDDDETDIDELWLVAEVQARLARARHMRTPTPEVERMVYMMSQDAERLRPRVVTIRSAWSVVL